MIIDCIADTHGHYPELELEGGDLLIVAGDLTARDTQLEIDLFDRWLSAQTYKKKIFIAGNHDNRLLPETPRKYLEKIGDREWEKFEYLCDSGTEFEGLKIWGSPWTKRFEGMNPRCMAFTVDTEEELAEKWAMIPDDVDILVTHCPPYGILDRSFDGIHCGSLTLLPKLAFAEPSLHVFGHIHEAYGERGVNIRTERLPAFMDIAKTISVNASHVNEHYEPVNKPIRVIL